MTLESTTWTLAGNLVSAQFSAAVRGFPLPGPTPMAMLRKPDDQTMVVLQGSEEERAARLATELEGFEPTAWVVAALEPAADADEADQVLVIEIHEGEHRAELRLPFTGALNLVGAATGLPSGEGLAAFREGFIDGYGHELRHGPAAPLFDDDYAAGREMRRLALGDNIRLVGGQLGIEDGDKVGLVDLDGVVVTAETARALGVAAFVAGVGLAVMGLGWVCGGIFGLAVAAVPGLFLLLVALVGGRARPHLCLDNGTGKVMIPVRGATLEETEAFVAALSGD